MIVIQLVFALYWAWRYGREERREQQQQRREHKG